MSFFVNDTELKSVYYNSQKISEVYFNNVRVWKEGYPWVGWANANWSDIYNLCKAIQSGECEEWPSDVVLGATKTTTLSSDASDGTRTCYSSSKPVEMVLIGIDIDGPGVLTFHQNVIETYGPNTTNSPGYAYWNSEDSGFRKLCQSFYANCDAKPYIKPLTKTTCIKYEYTNKIVPTMVETTDTVWALSPQEAGFTGVVYVKSEYMEGYDLRVDVQVEIGEFTKGVSTPYPYYTTNASRVKNKAWRLRSNHTYRNHCHMIVDTSGALGGTGGNLPGPAVAFAIG